MYESKTVWTARPSQWINLNAFFGGIGFLTLLIILGSNGVLDPVFRLPVLRSSPGFFKIALFSAPLMFILWRWLQVHFHQYELTEEVFREHYGVFNRISQELELYRVSDAMIYKPFELNVMGLGNIVMHTTDASTPVVVIRAIRNPERLREALRQMVEQQRVRRGVVEIGNR